MGKKRLTNSRRVDANSTNRARCLVELDNTVIWRDLRIDDYGIDALLEFFPQGEISGRYMPMQLKGTAKSIAPLSRLKGFVSCKISCTTLEYGRQDVLPVLILYVSLEDETVYYDILQNNIKREGRLQTWEGVGKEVTVHLPVSNVVSFSDESFGETLWELYQVYIDEGLV